MIKNKNKNYLLPKVKDNLGFDENGEENKIVNICNTTRNIVSKY
jgi:hypothetical protein